MAVSARPLNDVAARGAAREDAGRSQILPAGPLGRCHVRVNRAEGLKPIPIGVCADGSLTSAAVVLTELLVIHGTPKHIRAWNMLTETVCAARRVG